MSSHLPDGAPRASILRPVPRALFTARRRPAPKAHPSAPRRPRRGLLALVVSLGLTVLPSAAIAASPPSTGVAPAGVAHETDQSDQPDTVTTTLVSMTPSAIRPGDTVTVVARIHNGTDETIQSPRATLGVSWRAVGTRSALDAWADAPTSQRPAEAMSIEELDPLGPGRDTQVTFTVNADDFNLAPGSAWGPRPLSITVDDQGERLDVVRSFFVWGESQAPLPVRLSLLAPVTGPALNLVQTPGDAGADGSPQIDVRAIDDAVLPDQRLGRLAAATAGVPEIAWAVDPALVAAAETSTDPDTLAWASQVRDGTTGRTVFGLRPYDPDPGAYAQVDAPLPATTTLLPGGLTLDPGLRTDLTYPADQVPDLATVRASVQAGSPLVVVRADGLAPQDSVNYTPTGLATVQTDAGIATALVADDALTQAFTAATSIDRSPAAGSTTDATQRLLAEAAVVATQRPTDSRHLLIALPRTWDPDGTALTSVLDALTEAGWVDISPLDDLLQTPVPDVARTALPQASVGAGTLGVAEMRALQRARAEVSAFATVASDPSPIVQAAEPSLVLPTSIAYRADPPARTTAVDTAIADATTLRSAVSIVPRGLDVTLINTSGKIPVRVRNTLDQPVTVQVSLRPDSPLLKIVSFPLGEVAPGADVDLKVPVEAIGSGDVGVTVELLAVPSGTVISPPSEFVVQVRAAWETTGTAIFAGFVALLMVGGIWRTIRRGRSPRRVAELTPATGVPHTPHVGAPSGQETDPS